MSPAHTPTVAEGAPRPQNRAFDAALFIYAALIPFESLTIGAGSITRAWGLVLAAIGVASSARRFNVAPWIVALLLSPGYLAGLSTIWSIDPNASVQRMATYISLAVVAILIVGIGSHKSIRAASYGLLSGSAIASYFVSQDYQKLQYSIASEIRSSTAGANANDLAATLAISAALGLGLALTASTRRQTWLCAMSAVVCTTAVILTASRTATAAIAFAAAIAIIMRGGTLVRRSLLLSSLLIGYFFLLPRVDVRITDRILGAYNSAIAGDLNYRTHYWHIALDYLNQRPWHGWGAGAFPSIVERELHQSGATHNSALDMAVAFGITGILLFTALAAAATVSIRACKDSQIRLTLALAGITLAINMALLSWDYRKLPWLILALGILASKHRADGDEHLVPSHLELTRTRILRRRHQNALKS